MLKQNLCRASLVVALSAVVCAAGTAFAQDGAKKEPVSTRSIRPFVRSETPANQAPNLYDASSDEFNYFREDLGRQEMSTKQKQRLEQLANRVVYEDPMDKPAADGSPFVDVYSADEVFEDGETFIGLDDPDVIYADDEHNILAQFAEACSKGASTLSLLSGVGAGSSANDRNAMGAGSMVGGPAMPMPSVSMDMAAMPGSMGGMASDGKDGGSAAKAPAKEVAASKKDDSKMLFPEAAENPFAAAEPAEDDFDIFKADLEFAPKAAPANGMGGMGMGMGGNATEGMNMSIPMGVSGGMPPAQDK